MRVSAGTRGKSSLNLCLRAICLMPPCLLLPQEQLDAAAEAESDATGLKERVATLERELAAARKAVRSARGAHSQAKVAI